MEGRIEVGEEEIMKRIPLTASSLLTKREEWEGRGESDGNE